VGAVAIVVATACAARRGAVPRPPVTPAVAPARPAAPSVPASTAPSTAATPTTTAAPTTATGATTAAPTTPTADATTAPPFASSVGPVTAADLGATWHAGCPVGPADLRMLDVTYWGFDGTAHRGSLVVNAAVTAAVTRVFASLYADRFPIREIVPQSAYGGDDNAAAAVDDTSGFNCRLAVAPGPPQWSVHAYGEAIDVDDVENPYVDGSTVIPPAGAAFLDRSVARPGMAVAGGALVTAFAAVGWQWGGRWTATPDYQHFSATGG